MPTNWHDMILSVYRGEDPGGVVWQPRLEFWYHVNKRRGTLPKKYEKATLIDLYDDLGCSIRYFVQPLRVKYQNVKVTERREGERLYRTWHTPVGELHETLRYNQFGLSGYHEEYKIKTPDDLRVYEYMLEDATYEFDWEHYEQAVAAVGNRGVPQFYYRRSPVQSLIIENMGFEATTFALHDWPEAIERFVEVATRADDRMYEVLLSSPVPILNFGENIDCYLDSPPVFTRYHIPYYRRRIAQMKAAGKFCHIHIDGYLRTLLPYLQACEWDGIEAATPFPQGDVTLEEIKEAMGDVILLDGIPCLYFLRDYSVDDLVECVEKCVRLFYPRLILGISDEIPPDGDIERVRLVSEMVKELKGK